MEIEIKGHSGCIVGIENIAEGNGLCIVKSTKDKAYFPRLIRQAEKQSVFYERKIRAVNVPKIFDVTIGEDETSFRMEFVYSMNFVDYFEKISVIDIDAFVQTITDFIDEEIKLCSINQSVCNQQFEEKYNSVKETISRNIPIKSDMRIINLLRKTDNILKDSKPLDIPVGLCHGDLTLSNILFNGQKICLIDFLDSFIETPLMDIVKIRQDTLYAWSLLMYTNKCDIPRMKLILKYIDRQIHEYYSPCLWYQEWYIPFQLLNLLRVLQYAKEKKVIDFLIRSVETTIQKM